MSYKAPNVPAAHWNSASEAQKCNIIEKVSLGKQLTNAELMLAIAGMNAGALADGAGLQANANKLIAMGPSDYDNNLA